MVLLSTYNGEKFLREQLDSVLSQKGVILNILVRDDGSSDGTCDILNEYQNRGLLRWYTGDNLGPAKSFMDLVYNAPECEYYAFCDQDDYWLEDKLKIAVNQIKEFPLGKPALYYGRPRLVDRNLNLITNSNKPLDRMLDYKSALINSNATGCTMVFNRSLLEKVKEKKPNYIAMHDSWFHKVCIVAGGNLHFDEDVHIMYRQHGNNVVGISNSKTEKIKKRLMNKECTRSRAIASLLDCYQELMTQEEKYLAYLVVNYKNGIIPRIKLLLNNDIKTDYFIQNVMFKLMILFGTF